MAKKYLFLFLGFLACGLYGNAQVQTISATYSAGDIPTAFNAYDSTCNGPSTALTVTLPATTGNWEVLGVDIAYDMTAANVAYMSEQRSRVHFQNNGFTEATINGSGSTGGTFSYSRTALTFANGYYAGGTSLIFEMQAWRTWGSTAPNAGCGTHYNKVDNNTWIITVHYQVPPTCISPTNVQTGNATNTSIDVAWTDTNTPTPASWNIEYGAPGFAQGTGITHVATTNPTTIGSLTTDTDYEFYIQADCGTTDGTSFWEGPFAFSTTIDCSIYTLDITSSSGDTVACQGTATLTATSTGTGDDIYWYDAAVGGNIVGTGSTFVTPVISTTTSYWASEIKMESGSGGATPTYCVPTYPTGCTVGDDIDDFDMSSAGISHTGTGCSTGAYADYTNDPNLVGVMNIGSTYSFSATHNFANQWLKIWIDLDQDGTFSASELLFASPGGSANTTGSITIPGANGGATVMRVMGRYANLPTDACNPGGTFGETHDYKVIISDVACESPREEVVATVDVNGDVQVTTLPYNDSNNDTANYGDPFAGSPGSSCGTTENYLNGNNVVYKFTAPNTELVDILLSDLTDFYASVFVYDNCGEIGNNCLAGEIAGPSDDDFGIEDFQVTAGEDYYIVVSSWLSSTVGYTLDIIPFDCASLATPDGDSPQDFVTGDMLSDLEVETTENPATLNWYAGPGATSPISDTTTLMDNTTYFVTQTFNGCESAPTSILVEEIDCSALAINQVTDTGAVNCQGQVTFTATASGTGNEIYWYDVATGGNPIEFGNTFTTPVLTSTTSYWVSEVNAEGLTSTGNAKPAITPGSTDFGGANYGLIFTANQSFTIVEVDIYPDGEAGTFDIELVDHATNTVITSTSVTVPNMNGDTPMTVPLNFFVPQAGDYRLIQQGVIDMTRDFSGITFPYDLGPNGSVGQVTSGCFGATGSTSTSYYYFYNWTISTGELICESTPRTEVTATVNQTGDVQVAYTDLPYNTSDSTAIYGDSFQGDPGADCPGAAYLDGNEVIYQYTADPVNDDILQIELSGITNPNTGMYIYTSCGEVGTNCLTGVTNEDSPSAMAISDYYINAGETIFIVISSENNTVNYTLDIYGFDCATAPLVDVDTAPYFVQPDTLSDIDVGTDPNSTTYTWYADAALTMPVADPTIENLVDGMTYYVTQTILGCESAPVAVTVVEFNCAAMGVSQTNDVVICAPGGNVTLSAQSTGIGYDIFWYDAASGGNVVATGTNPSLNVTQTTSFWASEVYLGSGVTAGPISNTYCVPSYPTGCTVGDDIDDFVMSTAGISHSGTGCSANAYTDYTTDPSLVGNMTIGNTYNFSATHNFANQWLKIWIDLNQDGTFDDATELLFASTSGSANTTGSITIPGGTSGSTVMRVMGRYAGSPTGACNPGGTFGETHDYKVIIGSILCESTREEVVVTVNDQPTAVPTGTSIQKLCTGATIADLTATGSDLQWYASDTASTPLGLNHELEDGETYYVTQTIDACESQTRLAVTVEIKDVAALPTGPTNQDFVQGETILDLTVTGTNLTWYTSNDGMIFTEVTDPSQVNLTDQTTYYVTQTPNGFCESDKLPIKVHRVVGLDHPNFEGLVYYPNPVRDYLSIANRKAIDEIVVFNLLGQQVVSEKLNTTEAIIDMSYLAAGPYMVKITVEEKSTMVKIIKE
ncbi:GEVED domain-containing protein [Mesonia sp. K7]|uniref:T9SS type A sorting domain-containing protein n=1 Tax=Mesonia sp. K7 TaxID=2218606 RepID=UPI000DA97224|nr:GEVED domain-containing protein [Mesonia sp. K7]PZD78624.1 hypothetical protein DNG35_03970 [Mesonia sp. K7]